MARKRYWVVPDGADWSVKHEGTVVSTHSTKAQAVEAGRKVALANLPSQLTVKLKNGTIEQEWTYGNDPYPPRD
ncbi:DUF2188 domain-containing protein [Nocardia sp. CS682]|uniref:DUF2188 domain-containing protein n=1 Tax=Nocardia sp. CS682 TaxID=1047172 RepID=UPI001075779D|nr:DUF2188 domain-containing protein [Nocardia sp. CS682]QBS42850.1 hypothetical protein DMB37_24880 [Nocardia sp. CS682]